MNKTIIININGIVFHIEEDAYELLKTYMTEVKRHFAYSSDSDEIITDIENRLAEMFTERLAAQSKQVIVIQDVIEITAQMGSVNDFEDIDGQPEDSAIFSEKRLYRDPDDKTIAGVCSGVAHYFDIEVKWVRILAILSIFLSGSGLIIYGILWLVIPEAKTRQERMAMKGEPLNLQNFKKSFDDEVEAFKGNFNKPGFQKSADTIGDFVNNLFELITKGIKICIKAIGALIIFAGGMALLGLIGSLLFFLGFWNNEELNVLPFIAINPEYRSSVYISAFLLSVIPLIALILFAVRVIFNRKLISRTGSFAMLVLWLTGLGMGVYYGSKIASEFKEEARFEQRSDLLSYPVYYLKLNPNRLLTHEDSLKLNIAGFNGNILIDDHDDFDRLTEFDLHIEKSDEAGSMVFKEFKAQGKTFESALKTAQKTQYQFLQTDSTLIFDKYLYLSDNALYRDQKVNVTLKIPVDTRLIIDGTMRSHLHGYNLNDCGLDDTDSDTRTEWIMTTEGLKCKNDSLYSKAKDKL
ncbi:PspC domain-containing protein [Desertivirga xinjiangensis]|uniref:PspC domain-containing protein n=1 Tax=Desertivirga xinjiangensis TaxID=539206 RepID=UPI00210CB663|nr:PspC domain-containing protein [Pedobacter xinjiangensis]